MLGDAVGKGDGASVNTTGDSLGDELGNDEGPPVGFAVLGNGALPHTIWLKACTPQSGFTL